MITLFNEDFYGISAEIMNWIVMGAIALVALFVIVYLIRLARRPRMAGGRRSKHARLAITDAAAVDDAGRTIVLIRRDDVEHLVLIGGASDLVIESNIRKNAPARPLAQADTSTQTPQLPPATPQPAAPPRPQPQAAPVSAAPAPVTGTIATPPSLARPTPPPPTPQAEASQPPAVPQPAPVLSTVATPSLVATPTAPVAPSTTTTQPANQSGDLTASKSPASATVPSVDSPRKMSSTDEMDALLDEITNKK